MSMPEAGRLAGPEIAERWWMDVAKIGEARVDELSPTRLKMLVSFGAANYHWFCFFRSPAGKLPWH